MEHKNVQSVSGLVLLHLDYPCGCNVSNAFCLFFTILENSVFFIFLRPFLIEEFSATLEKVVFFFKSGVGSGGGTFPPTPGFCILKLASKLKQEPWVGGL